MDQVQVEVLEAQVLQGNPQRRLDGLRAVVGVPQFAGDVQVFTFDDALGDLVGYGFTDFLLVAVHVGTVEVAVPHVDGILHGLGHFLRLGLGENQRVMCGARGKVVLLCISRCDLIIFAQLNNFFN